jgi:hypothetical protein
MSLLSALVVLACLPGPSGAPLDPSAGCADGPRLHGFSYTNVLDARLASSSRAYAGATALRATFAGGSGNAYARGVRRVRWRTGDDVWYGAAFYLPAGFIASMQGEVALMRWDNWPTYGTAGADVGGLVIWGRDGRARLKTGTYRTESTLVGPFDLPESRWFWVEVHQRFAAEDGQALTEVYLDGRRVGDSTRANMTGRTIERLRTGLVAIEAGHQTNPLTLWFDRAAIGRSELGPLAGG